VFQVATWMVLVCVLFNVTSRCALFGGCYIGIWSLRVQFVARVNFVFVFVLPGVGWVICLLVRLLLCCGGAL